jgi:hypothetical protein
MLCLSPWRYRPETVVNLLVEAPLMAMGPIISCVTQTQVRCGRTSSLCHRAALRAHARSVFRGLSDSYLRCRVPEPVYRTFGSIRPAALRYFPCKQSLNSVVILMVLAFYHDKNASSE